MMYRTLRHEYAILNYFQYIYRQQLEWPVMQVVQKQIPVLKCIFQKVSVHESYFYIYMYSRWESKLFATTNEAQG